jgi:hypothetical protein
MNINKLKIIVLINELAFRKKIVTIISVVVVLIFQIILLISAIIKTIGIYKYISLIFLIYGKFQKLLY